MIHEFGFVILEISPSEPHDSGYYTCKATNKQGSDSVKAQIKVQGGSGISQDYQQPYRKGQIEKLDEYLNRPPEQPVIPDKQFDQPLFLDQLGDLGEFMEAESCHFEAKLEPVGDTSLRIYWYHNGELIPYSSRIQTRNDFGLVSLTVKHLIPEDSGDYVCLAVNSKGQAQSNGRVLCRSKVDVEAPKFVTSLAAQLIGIPEGEDVHMECRFTPVTDPKLQILWYFNDKPLLTGSRFKMVYDFGYVSLDIKGAISEDTGKYKCRAVNEKGEAFTECVLSVTS
uniref:Ig-like domain-containing protein n=1 Tax=Romanomermis culicivorax TaxID=13658 RepID=A0A915LBB0_ROMCU